MPFLMGICVLQGWGPEIPSSTPGHGVLERLLARVASVRGLDWTREPSCLTHFVKSEAKLSGGRSFSVASI